MVRRSSLIFIPILGAVTEIPFNTWINSVYSIQYSSINTAVNVYWKWSLFITENYIFLFGEPQTNLNLAYPIPYVSWKSKTIRRRRSFDC